MHSNRHQHRLLRQDGYRRIEVITGQRRCRQWSDEEGADRVGELCSARQYSAVARRHGMNCGLLHKWRGQARQARASTAPFIPIALADGAAAERMMWPSLRLVARSRLSLGAPTFASRVRSARRRSKPCWRRCAKQHDRDLRRRLRRALCRPPVRNELSPAQMSMLLEGLAWSSRAEDRPSNSPWCRPSIVKQRGGLNRPDPWTKPGADFAAYLIGWRGHFGEMSQNPSFGRLGGLAWRR